MEIKIFYVPGISHFSYAIIGTNAIAIVDPKRIIDDYLKLAEEHVLPIKYIFLTHNHADFIGGHLLLAEATGAEICGGPNLQTDYPIKKLSPVDEVSLGGVYLKVVETPGHTPDHASYLLFEEGAKEPFAIFSGDSLFSGDIGRPDLFGPEKQEELVKHSFETIKEYRALPDHVLLYPAHGAGSFCGKRLSQRCPSSIGYEKRHNPMLKIEDFDEFKETLFSQMPTPPAYYFKTSRRNQTGEGLKDILEPPRRLSFEELKDSKSLIIDLRDQAAFATFHIPGSLNIAADIHLAMAAGFVLDSSEEYLLLGSREEIERALPTLYMMGIDRVKGVFPEGIEPWRKNSQPFSRIEYLSPLEAEERLKTGDTILLDVRTESEFAEGHIPGARFCPLAKLKSSLNDLPRDKFILCQCGHGCRGSLAASLLKRAGFERVGNLAGGIMAWKASGLPIE